MKNWSAGYVADVAYTFGYYSELNPLRVDLAFLNQGLVIPNIGAACELGFGQGLSAAMHAAGSVTSWHGTDFNPTQAGFAQELAALSGSDAKFYDDAFADFARRDDLPEFDYIGLHGIWSWISDENRAVIVDFILRKLKVGGVLYISYNTLPGWAAFAPMRHLMAEHTEIMGSEGRGMVSRIDDALDFANRLLATDPSFARKNPGITDRINKLKDKDRHYLAHEYFNRDWAPMHFSTMADWLESAKLSYACSANYLDSIDGINLTKYQQSLLNEITNDVFRESVRDFMVDQQFRRDYWVKGPRRLSPVEQAETMRAQKVILTSHRPDVSLKVTTSLGEAQMGEKIYGPILDFLASSKIKTLSQVEEALKSKGINLAQISEAIMVLAAQGHVAPAQEDSIIQKARKHTDKLNAHICARARGSAEIVYLASPVTGGGIHVSRFQQCFLLALRAGHKQPEEWAVYALKILQAQGQKIIKEGKTLETSDENLAELIEQANNFAEKRLPILNNLGIA